jgi:lipopolysaccharide heptosyltransferase I
MSSDRFLIIKLSSLGDIIHTLPAFSALRRNFPVATITWAVEEKGKEILDLVPELNEVTVIARKNWLSQAKVLRRRDQVALDFQGLVKSGLLAYLSRARRRIGFHRKNCREPLASIFYTEKPAPLPEEERHVIAKNLSLLTCLGIREEKFDFPISIPEELSLSVEAKLRERGYDRKMKLLLFNLGAAWKTKRWFVEKWAALIRQTHFPGSFPLLLWGNADERELALAVQDKTNVAMTPFLSVKEVIALVRGTSLLVSGDTFALQVACALSVPVVGLFGPTSPHRNGPFRPQDRVVFPELDCSPCYKKSCSTLDCLHRLTSEEAAAAVRDLWLSHEQG